MSQERICQELSRQETTIIERRSEQSKQYVWFRAVFVVLLVRPVCPVSSDLTLTEANCVHWKTSYHTQYESLLRFRNRSKNKNIKRTLNLLVVIICMLTLVAMELEESNWDTLIVLAWCDCTHLLSDSHGGRSRKDWWVRILLPFKFNEVLHNGDAM